MNKEKICFSSKTIEIAETDTYLELTNRVCFYDEPNLNNVELLSEDALEKAQTLVNMPVVAKYTQVNGKPSFKGHEVYIDADGDIAFGTDSIGTHISVEIKDDNVDVKGVIKTLPCLFAKYRIWKRNKNVVAAVQRLYSEDKLYSSWELSTLAYEFKNGVKKLSDYIFLSNCLLGFENAFPAYGTDARAISMSECAPELLVAEAFAQDLLLQESEDDKLLNGNKKNEPVVAEEPIVEPVVTEEPVIAEEPVVEPVEPEEPIAEPIVSEEPVVVVEPVTEPDVSALTDYDLRVKLNNACRAKLGSWCWVSYLFPTEQECWVVYDSETETDYKLFTYVVNNDEVEVSEPVDVKLVVEVKQVNNTFAELNEKIDTLNNSLVEASSIISDLNMYKEKFEEAEQLKIAAEQDEKRNALKLFATKSGFITEEELETSEEIKVLIETVNETGIKSIIAERFMKTLDEKKVVETSTEKTVEDKAIASIVIGDNDEVIDYKSTMKSFLKK